jgi:hypothetical protein
MANMSFTKTFYKFELPEDKGNHVKVNTHTWLGIVIDTWKMDVEKPYLQMVGYFNTAEGKEILLARKDIKLLDVDSLDFFNERRRFFCDLSSWSFHGFADNLHFDITAEDLVESRKVVHPGDPANAAVHETKYYNDKLELGGKLVHFEVKSLKKTKGPFMQRLKVYVADDTPHVRRQFLIDLPVTKDPFIKLGDHFEQHKTLIAETLGLNLEK